MTKKVYITRREIPEAWALDPMALFHAAMPAVKRSRKRARRVLKGVEIERDLPGLQRVAEVPDLTNVIPLSGRNQKTLALVEHAARMAAWRARRAARLVHEHAEAQAALESAYSVYVPGPAPARRRGRR